MSDRKAVIKNADMGEEMQQDAVDCATQALEKYNIEKVRKLPLFVFVMSRDIEYGDLHSWLRQSIDLAVVSYNNHKKKQSFLSLSHFISEGKIINISDLL